MIKYILILALFGCSYKTVQVERTVYTLPYGQRIQLIDSMLKSGTIILLDTSIMPTGNDFLYSGNMPSGDTIIMKKQ